MEAAANLMQIDVEVVRRWESCEWKPPGRTAAKAEQFLNGQWAPKAEIR